MPEPPGQLGLVGRLEALERRVRELKRSGNRGTPLLVVRLAADVDAFNVEKKNVMPVTSWNPTPEVDTRNMWHYNVNGDTYAELPCAGRFRIVAITHWRVAQNYSSTAPNSMATSIWLNSRTDPLAKIGQAIDWHGHGDSTTNTCVVEDRVFASGDIIRVNYWAHYISSMVRAVIWNTDAWSHLMIRYVGPE